MGRRGLALIVALLLAIPAFAGQPPTETQSDRGSPSRALRPVTAERLVNADAEPDNWLMYSGDYKSRRYTGLDQIDTTNVAGLQVRWVHQMAELGRAGTTPLVVDGVMYITEPPSSVIALDAGTGRPYWRYDHPLPDELNYCCGQANRGVAIQGDRLFMSTLDAHVVALDARTGNVLWDAEAGDPKQGLQQEGGAAGGGRQDHHRHRGWRVRHPRVPGRV